MVFLAVKDAGTDSANEISFVSSHKNDLNDLNSGIFNTQKDHKTNLFSCTIAFRPEMY
jgi:methionine salvage enolase-phosphatase E1